MLRRGLRCEPLCSFASFSYHREDRIANIMAFAFLAISPCCLRRNGILSNAFSLLCFIHDILTDLRKSESPTKPHFCIIYVPQFRSSSLWNCSVTYFRKRVERPPRDVNREGVRRYNERIIHGYIMIRLYELQEKEEKKGSTREKKLHLYHKSFVGMVHMCGRDSGTKFILIDETLLKRGKCSWKREEFSQLFLPALIWQ